MFDWYKKVVFENYANFTGRARRSEYWNFVLVNFLINLSLWFLLFFLGFFINIGFGFLFYLVLLLYGLAIIIPSLAAVVRRLHDINKSGWYYFVFLIPIVGIIWLLVMLFTEGDRGENYYGPDPKMESAEINIIGTE